MMLVDFPAYRIKDHPINNKRSKLSALGKHGNIKKEALVV